MCKTYFLNNKIKLYDSSFILLNVLSLKKSTCQNKLKYNAFYQSWCIDTR